MPEQKVCKANLWPRHMYYICTTFVYFHSSTQFFHICLHKFHGIVGNSLVQRNLWQTLQSLFTYRHSRVLLRYLDIIQN